MEPLNSNEFKWFFSSDVLGLKNPAQFSKNYSAGISERTSSVVVDSLPINQTSGQET